MRYRGRRVPALASRRVERVPQLAKELLGCAQWRASGTLIIGTQVGVERHRDSEESTLRLRRVTAKHLDGRHRAERVRGDVEARGSDRRRKRA